MNHSRYQVLQILGQSRWVCTYRALDQAQQPPRPCVIKQLQIGALVSGQTAADCAAPDLQQLNQMVRERFEASQHPQLPAWIDSFVEPTELPCLCWVQDYIEGDSLADLCSQPFISPAGVSSTGISPTNIGPTDIWDILASLLPVLQHLHQHQVIHGDIKPENVIYPASNSLASNSLVLNPLASNSSASTFAASVKPQWRALTLVDCALPNLIRATSGSPEYAAPEQLRGQVTCASDLYSLGLTCLHLLTGLSPLELAGPEQWSALCGPDLSEALVQFLARLTAPDLSQRYASATAAIAALECLRGQKLKPPVSQSLPSWRCFATLSGHQGLFATVNAVAVSPDSTPGSTPDSIWLASASDDKTLRLWHGADASWEATVFEGHQGFVRAVAFHPQQPWLVSAGQDRMLRIWDYQTRQVIRVLSGHSQTVNAVAFSPDGRLLASGSSDKTVKLWQDLPQQNNPQQNNSQQHGECLATLKGHRLAVNGLALGQNQQGQLILVSGSSDGTVRFWDLANQTCQQVLTEHRQAVRTVAVSPSRIASAGEDRVIHLWNWSGELLKTLSGHSWTVTGLAFGPDGQTLVSASWDKTLKLWSVETGAEIALLAGHSDSVCGVCFSPWGDVVSASRDQTLKLWRQDSPISRSCLSSWA